MPNFGIGHHHKGSSRHSKVIRSKNFVQLIDVNGRDFHCATTKVPEALEMCVHECQRNFLPEEQMDCVTAVEHTYAPVPACFSANTWTYVVGKGKVTMPNLEVGDIVLDENLAYTKIVGWLHNDPRLKCPFIKIPLHGFDSLTVSPDHLLYDPSKKDYVLAEDVSSVRVMSCDATFCDILLTPKHRYDVVNSKGVYAPLTESGTILVQNVVASCYSAPERYRSLISHRSANTALWPVRSGYVPFDFHAVEEYIEMLCELGELAE